MTPPQGALTRGDSEEGGLLESVTGTGMSEGRGEGNRGCFCPVYLLDGLKCVRVWSKEQDDDAQCVMKERERERVFVN